MEKVVTIEMFEEVKEYFGMIVIEINMNKSAPEIYVRYKKLWEIETFYKFFKNKINYETINITDYYASQELLFIMLID